LRRVINIADITTVMEWSVGWIATAITMVFPIATTDGPTTLAVTKLFRPAGIGRGAERKDALAERSTPSAASAAAASSREIKK
jgi:hypothetical protein